MASKTPSLVTSVRHCLQDGKLEESKELLKNVETQDLLDDASWDLVPTVCEFITDEALLEKPELIDTCEELLVYMAKTCSAKELLLSLLDKADSFKTDIVFKALIQPIQEVLYRLPDKRHHSLDVVVETLYAHLKTLEIPEDMGLEGEERKFLENDPRVVRIGTIVQLFLEFLEPFIKEVSYKNFTEDKPRNQKQVDILTKFLLQILHHPLVEMDLTDSSDAEANIPATAIRVCAEKLTQLLAELHGDFNKIVIKMSGDSQEGPSELSLSCWVYLVMAESLSLENMPSVYTARYKLLTYLRYVTALCGRKESMLCSKGVILFQALLESAPEGILSSQELESSQLTDCFREVVNVIIRCPVKEIRQKALQLLPLLLKRFDMRGRHQFLYHLLATTNHSGLNGYLIQLLKEEIDQQLKHEDPDAYFTAPKVHRLFDLVFKLPDGATSDLLDDSDKIMASLNLLRYLVLRDKKQEDVTGIWTLLQGLEKDYMEVLRTAVNMSRVHYQMELENAKNNKKPGPAGDSPDTELCLTVGGTPMPALSREQQMQVFQTALFTFDMMESLLGRIGEIVSAQPK